MLKISESAWRNRAKKVGLKVVKSRTRYLHSDDFGGYMLVDLATNAIVAGSNFALTLSDVAELIEAETQA